MFKFIYDDKVLYENDDENKVIEYVDEWLMNNPSAIDNPYSNKDNHEEWFMRFIEEVIYETPTQ